jgi:hypothetical protein
MLWAISAIEICPANSAQSDPHRPLRIVNQRKVIAATACFHQEEVTVKVQRQY